MSSFEDRNQLRFEELLRDGVTAVKSGQISLAQSLLNRASILNPLDARPYLWLSATTDDPEEQREYLEQAVACDPSNASARRGLALLTGKLDEKRLVGGSMTAITREAEPEVEGIARTMNCPQCGGRISTQVSSGLLTCVYCDYQAELRDDRLDPQPVSDRLEQVMDFVLPTVSGHAWAEGRLNLSCESCGARSLLPAGQKSQQCAYCGSSQLVDSPAFRDLVDPQVIALMHVDESQANRLARSWLRKGLLAPDDLIQSSRQMRLRPAYYSCWTFDGTIEARWSCEVKESRGNQEHWEAMSGAHVEFFNDVLVSGVKALKEGELAGLEPFNLIEVEAFKPEYLAGWTAMVYDRSLADASLVAREKVVRRLKPLLYNLVAIGREKRNLSLNGCNWSGMTFKHVLLPVWIGTYQYGKEKFTLLVNGQTGKVAGEKPRDTIKMVFGSLSMVALIVLGLIGLWLFLRMRQGIY